MYIFSKYEIIQGEFNYYARVFGAVLNYIRTFLIHEKIQIDRKLKLIYLQF